MKVIGTLFFLLFANFVKVNAQLNIPYGKIPTIDGHLDSLEWADADSGQHCISSSKKTIGILYYNVSSQAKGRNNNEAA